MKKIDVYLTEQQIALLKELSFDTGLTVSEHIRRAIDEYLQRRKKDDKGSQDSAQSNV